MRIVLVNWAPLADGASHGGGVNGYCHWLAMELVSRGHEVISLTSGLTYVPKRWETKRGVCEARRMPDVRGVRVFEIVNSPVMAPALLQFRRPLDEIASVELEREVSRVMRLVGPEIVHFQNIEGFSVGCVDAARGAGKGAARVLFSLHNYHTLCPQLYLMRGGERPCFDFDNGHHCVNCWDAPHPHIALAERLERHMRGQAPSPAQLARAVASRGKRSVAERLAERFAGDGPEMPGVAVRGEQDVARRAPEGSAGGTGETALPMALHAPRDVLENVPTPEPASMRAPNDYAKRRRAMVEMLSRCDRVLAVSEFVRRKFIAMGVKQDVVRTVPIGVRLQDIVGGGGAPTGTYEPPRSTPNGPSRPIRLVFLGYHNFFKGLHMLLDTLEELPRDVARHLELSVHAKDIAGIEHRLRALPLHRVVVEGAYRYEDIPLVVRGGDAGVVPSVWWDNGPQTVFEFQACGMPVIAAEVGGIPDFVAHNVNGLLFGGNDRDGLARVLADVCRRPEVLAELRSRVRPPKSMAQHGAEMEAEYRACVSRR